MNGYEKTSGRFWQGRFRAQPILDEGFLPISLTQYLDLLDWTGRAIRSDKRGSIPAHLSPILSRIGLEASGWCDLVKRFGRLFKRVPGTAETLAAEANRRGQNYLQAPALELMRQSTG